MTAIPLDVMSTYYAAWKAKDSATLSSVLAENVDFTGRFGAAHTADGYRAKIEAVSEIKTDIAVQKVFSDGADVVTCFEHHTQVGTGPGRCVDRVKGGKITHQRAVFDPGSILAALGR
ncbi:nuclear transport factor 2 family protein [Streptomyces sp. ISL-10]|uniref:nuclear transport factor 2 family protein n=1 Tax=Streptomyces sp. ISL-10 TaxID=2819172 RepID=UPI001BEC418C|nr:nuclear transport factor 2 family protein [Streptomyces sp. ISL-10]MBT2367960.1 nuclear transport factor 2 family protein [Streptomyces sp. ISL-10]